jgi:Tetracyclin repressor-like, C-terminal domain
VVDQTPDSRGPHSAENRAEVGELVAALVDGVYASLAGAVEAGRDARPVDDTAGRILAWAQAFRGWALANPEGFRIVYGEPIPGGRPDGAEQRTCVGLIGLVAAAWPHAEPLQAADGHLWSDFAPALVTTVHEEFPGLPPAAVALALRLWGRLHGLVSLEIYGHLAGQTHHPGHLYLAEVRDLIRSLGLTPPVVPSGPR